MNSWSNRSLPFILAATDHGTMIVNHNDYHRLSSGITYGVGHQLLTRSAFDPLEIELVLDQLSRLRDERKGYVTALDCGANIGVHTLEMSKAMTGWGHVCAIEAQERLYYALAGNIALNNLFNVQAIFAAVGDGDEPINVPVPNYFRPASFGSLELKKSDSTEYIGQAVDYSPKNLSPVPQIRLDSFINSRIDFIKLDIEGMEMAALTGGRQLITQYRPTMLIEWLKSDQTALKNFFSGLNYEIQEMGGNLLAMAEVK